MRAPRLGPAHLPALAEMEANLHAGVASAGKSDVPDALAWSDLRTALELTHHRFLRWLRTGRHLALVSNLPHQKSGKSARRRMASLSDYDYRCTGPGTRTKLSLNSESF